MPASNYLTRKMNEHAAKWRSDVVKAVRAIAPDAVVLGLFIDDDGNTLLAVYVDPAHSRLLNERITVNGETIPLVVFWRGSEWTVIE